jgi:hypothetical protein
MSAKKTSQKNVERSTSELEAAELALIYAEASDFKYWNSKLFNDLYLRRDLPQDYKNMWEDDDATKFQSFYEKLENVASEFSGKEAELTSWTETETISGWIKPTLEDLGWGNNNTGRQNVFLEESSFRFENKTLRTDILIVDHPDEKQYVSKADSDEKLFEARQHVIIPVEAKYWNLLEFDRQETPEDKRRADVEHDDASRSLSPNEQIIKYMEMLRKDWGILTDGATWRLFNREISSEDPTRYFEFNLFALIKSIQTQKTEEDRLHAKASAKYFYFFFRKDAFPLPENSAPTFLTELLGRSKKYVLTVQQELKVRFVQAMNITCNALAASAKAEGKSLSHNEIRDLAETILFNVLFIKSLESRSILPITAQDYRKLSLSNIVDKIEKFDAEKDDQTNLRRLRQAFAKGNGQAFDFKFENFEIHDRMVRLNEIVNSGGGKENQFGFEIQGFKETLFSAKQWTNFKALKITNRAWVRTLFQLGYAESDLENIKYQQIPYSYFTPRQLGSIYESFLEYKIGIADVDMHFSGGEWTEAKTTKKDRGGSSFDVRAGELFFQHDTARSATGSFYTPHKVVEFMLKTSFDNLLSGKSSEEILNFRVCDPAMGSGHFLSAALSRLAERFLEALSKERGSKPISKSDAKRQILERCIFGVDINSRAVKLAQMSLWLESAASGCPLQNLEGSLKSGNSLIESGKSYSFNFDWIREFPKVFKDKGFDLMIGNPPWGASLDEIKSFIPNEFPASSAKNLNSFELFVIKSLKLIKFGGEVSFVLPRNILRSEEYTDLRKSSVVPQIRYVADIGPAFEGVTQEGIVLTLDNQPRESFEIYPFWKLVLNKEKQFDPDTVLLKKDVNKKLIAVDDFGLSIYTSQQMEKIFTKIKMAGKGMGKSYLKDDSRGLEIGGKGELGVCPHCKAIMTKPKKKKKDSKPCPECAKQVKLENLGTMFVIDERKQSKDSPEIAPGRGIGAYSYEASGYLAMNVPSINYKKALFDGTPSIFMSKTSGDLRGFFDDSGKRFTTQSAIVLKPKDKNIGYWLTALLNSEVMNFFFEYLYVGGAVFTTALTKDILNALPVPMISSSKLEEIESAVNKMQSGKGDDKLLTEIDSIIRDAFKITASEMKLISSFMKMAQILKKMDIPDDKTAQAFVKSVA